MRSKAQIIGVISDTHGLLRPEVLEVFKDVSLILHAGDIGNPEVLKTLRTLAPVVAVRGNNDVGPWAKRIPQTKLIKAGRISIFMLHDLKEWKLKPRSDVVVSGHSHRPGISQKDGILFFNPGSAGPRRFKLPISVGRLYIQGSVAEAELKEIQ
ncbi:MAG TPA: metallophosphoesterase family protein [Pyrinomonadaceae bacterium]|nr:metallophosphoesterase family protein [Pyrinomonadaceae bacterium]